MTVLDEFFDSYLHYSVSQRLFEDRCRQFGMAKTIRTFYLTFSRTGG